MAKLSKISLERGRFSFDWVLVGTAFDVVGMMVALFAKNSLKKSGLIFELYDIYDM
jgi:hypothetical protein